MQIVIACSPSGLYLYEFEHKRYFLLSKQLIVAIDFLSNFSLQWGPSTVWSSTFFKISLNVQQKKLLKVWYMRKCK